jgi:hypothetical protein
MKKIVLLINGEKKEFRIPFVNGMVWRKFVQYRAEMDMNKLTPEEVDDLAGLVVYAFNDQFTLEQFYEGVPHDRVMLTIDELFIPSGEESEGNGKK